MGLKLPIGRVTAGALALVVAMLLGSWPARPALAATVPPNFEDSLVANSIGAPTALAFTPDGRLLITTQPGQLRVYQNGSLLPTAALDLSGKLCSNSERGLLGVAVDPSFSDPARRFIYLYYTLKKDPSGQCISPNAVNRVARFTLGDNNVVDPASEAVLIDNIHSTAGNHNGGDLTFGKDGSLYISVGDGGCDYAGSGCAGSNDAGRDRNVLIGKILRITPDGGIPSDNPYRGADSARCNVTGSTSSDKRCQEIFAWGLRNPFRFAFDPNAGGTRFFINDVGQNTWEEIDLGQAGADYGWNVREGPCARDSITTCGAPPAGMTNPLYAYFRGNSGNPSRDSNGANPIFAGCGTITGGAFVPNGVWPAAYDGGYLFGDYGCGKIFFLPPTPGASATEFVTALGGSSAVHLTFGPHGSGQALYYTSYAGGGEVRRIAFTGTINRKPVANVAANPTFGAAPLDVTLDATGSSDPDPGDSLTYLWDFGDGSPAVETTSLTTTHRYAAGTYTATLRVRDNQGAVSDPDTVQISAGNTPPQPTISTPAADARFAVGQAFSLSGGATDVQDGTLAASALNWTAILHHGEHTHPFLGPTAGNDVPLTAPAPEDLAATTNSFLEIRLTATDSQGIAATVVRELRPKLVDVTFASNPDGRTLAVNGTTFSAPRTLTSWEGYALNVSVPAQSDGCGQAYAFESWSDGGAASHTVVTPAAPASYTATFRAPPSCTSGAQLGSLIATVEGFELPPKVEKRLVTRPEAALRELSGRQPRTKSACDKLAAFVKRVQAETGKGLTADQAAQLREAANRVRGILGCR